MSVADQRCSGRDMHRIALGLGHEPYTIGQEIARNANHATGGKSVYHGVKLCRKITGIEQCLRLFYAGLAAAVILGCCWLFMSECVLR